ncbi:MAG: hypothetical protein U5L96_20365 [Owenweeksia sp.]|nr:hypothetical protein [Owenweeksia sp.]
MPYLIGARVHSDFKNFCDYVLLVETGSKAVSSSAGHQLMNNHPFAKSRFLQADQNLGEMLKTLADGDLEHWGQLVEREALSLHAMMMTSTPTSS